MTERMCMFSITCIFPVPDAVATLDIAFSIESLMFLFIFLSSISTNSLFLSIITLTIVFVNEKIKPSKHFKKNPRRCFHYRKKIFGSISAAELCKSPLSPLSQKHRTDKNVADRDTVVRLIILIIILDREAMLLYLLK